MMSTTLDPVRATPRVFAHPGELAAAVGDARRERMARDRPVPHRRFRRCDGRPPVGARRPGAREGRPFGACIAHGYLTLSLVNYFLPQIVRIDGARLGVNYGCDRIRFPAPVKVGARVRGVGELLRVEPLEGGVQA